MFKRLRVRRLYDPEHRTLIYIAHSTEITGASAKNSISTISLYGQDVRLPER